MASFPGAEPVFVFYIYLLSPTALHQLPERNTHDCKALLNVQQLCKPSSSFVLSSPRGTKVFCQNKVWGVSDTHLAAAVRGGPGSGSCTHPSVLPPSPWQPGLPGRCSQQQPWAQAPFSRPSHPSSFIPHFDS